MHHSSESHKIIPYYRRVKTKRETGTGCGHKSLSAAKRQEQCVGKGCTKATRSEQFRCKARRGPLEGLTKQTGELYVWWKTDDKESSSNYKKVLLMSRKMKI